MELDFDADYPLEWLDIQKERGVSPESILQMFGVSRSGGEDPSRLWLYLRRMLAQFAARNRPPPEPISDFNQVADLISRSSKILVVTGAGVSTSCGIPDFRSENGLYARLKIDYPDLPNPEAMFDKKFFKYNPRPFFDFAHDIYPGTFQPSPGHEFIFQLENMGKLLRNYTQNIDTLEQVAGITRVLQCHGSFATASCMICKRQVNGDDIKDQVFRKEIPLCTSCPPPSRPVDEILEEIQSSMEQVKQFKQQANLQIQSLLSRDDIEDVAELQEKIQEILSEIPDDDSKTITDCGLAIMKPDIVFFGEDLPDSFYDQLPMDAAQADLVIVMGSSLQVHPVASIPDLVPSNVPRILINREPVAQQFNAELLGDCDTIVQELSARLGGQPFATSSESPSSSHGDIETSSKEQGQVHTFEPRLPNRFLFKGADRQAILQREAKELSNDDDDESDGDEGSDSSSPDDNDQHVENGEIGTAGQNLDAKDEKEEISKMIE